MLFALLFASSLTLTENIRYDGNLCPVCATAMNYTYDKAVDNIDLIVLAAHVICDLLPESLHERCHSTVDTVLADLIRSMTTLMTPMELCCFMRFCPSKGSFGEERRCSLCTAGFAHLEDILQYEFTSSEIDRVLSQLCTAFKDPSSQKICRGFIWQNGAALETVLASLHTGATLCKMLAMC